jgi:hypothetical protein
MSNDERRALYEIMRQASYLPFGDVREAIEHAATHALQKLDEASNDGSL